MSEELTTTTQRLNELLSQRYKHRVYYGSLCVDYADALYCSSERERAWAQKLSDQVEMAARDAQHATGER